MPIPDFKDEAGKWRSITTINGKSIQTKSGSVWYDMRTRCNPIGSIQKRQPSYIGCTMSKSFTNFQSFAEWHIAQTGYSLLNYEIDKDLLVDGNKLYSEHTCVLIPHELNMFCISNNVNRGLWPNGVYLDQRRGTFQSRIHVNGKYVYLGAYETPELAYAIVKKAKEIEARRWYSRLKAGEFAVDPRVIERMRVWQLRDY